jgi:hypothetical protein
VNAIRQTLRGGGRVHGYADGGTIDLSPSEYVRQGFGDTRDAVASGEFDPQGLNAPGETTLADPPQMAALPLPRPRPEMAPAGPLPPIMTAGMGQDPEALPGDAMAYTKPKPSPYAMPSNPPPPMPGSPTPMGESPGAKESQLGRFNPFNLSDDARLGLMSAGLGMMASKSPFALTQIGEGGQAGVKTYSDQMKQRQTVESEARKLAQQASQFAQNLGLHRDQLKETTRQHDLMADRENNKFIGTNDEGFPSILDTPVGCTETVGKVKLQGKAYSNRLRARHRMLNGSQS